MPHTTYLNWLYSFICLWTFMMMTIIFWWWSPNQKKPFLFYKNHKPLKKSFLKFHF